ncbi:MAG: hypothetical protein WA040_11935, partial [Anaerolineae bacterium]
MSQNTAFDHLPRTARNHFLLSMYAAVYRLLFTAHLLDSAAPVEGRASIQQEFPFLAGYFEEMLRFMPADITWEQGWRWWQAELAAWEAGAGQHLPLLRLDRHAGLSAEARLALILAGLVEEDSRFGTVFARLQEPLPGRRPTVELIGQVMRGAGDADMDGAALARMLLDLGLVEVVNPDAARAEWALRVSGEIWDAARGDLPSRRGGWTYHPPEEFPAVDELNLPDPFV